MLLLRAVSTQKKRVCWFVVNGVPIRYSMREHALITGLDCHEYDSDFNEENFGSYDFVERVFGSKTVKVSQVKNMFESMDGECNGDHLQVAVLYFLSTIIQGRRKFDSIYSFILKAVNNLKALETFPWGRLTFEDNMKEIDYSIDHFKGQVRADYLYPGFIIPLEVLAFECIPDLSKQFQESVRGANNGCPLICKRKFTYLATSANLIFTSFNSSSIAFILFIIQCSAAGIFCCCGSSMEEPQQQNIPAAEHWMIKRMKAMEDELKEVKMRLADVARYVNMPR